MPETPENDQPEAYLRLLAQHEHQLATYIHSLVLNFADAEDLLQECKMTLWKKFSRFEEGTNFIAWARKIALHQILNFRRTRSRRPFTALDQSFIEAVAGEIDRSSVHLERRTEALRECLRKLPEPQRKLILWRYFEQEGIEGIANKTRRSEGAVYRALSRIRSALNECISKNLTAAEA